MAGSRRSKINIDMFPFLSVLCTVIGVMMLLIVLVLSTRAEHVEAQLAVAPVPISEIDQPTEGGIPDEEYEILRSRIFSMAAVLSERQGELRKLNKLILELEELIAAKEDETLEIAGGEGLVPGVELEKPEDVVFKQTSNAGFVKTPRFIEVTADEYILQPEDRHFSVSELEDKNSPLNKFLAEVDKARAKQYLVFLFHENGIAAFSKINEFVVEKYPHDDPGKRGQFSRIDSGKEPFRRNWAFIRQPLKSGN